MSDFDPIDAQRRRYVAAANEHREHYRDPEHKAYLRDVADREWAALREMVEVAAVEAFKAEHREQGFMLGVSRDIYQVLRRRVRARAGA